MELGRVGLFICSQKPRGNSSDHWVNNLTLQSTVAPQKRFFSLTIEMQPAGTSHSGAVRMSATS